MKHNQGWERPPWTTLRRTTGRALLLGVLAAIAGCSACGLCGAILCLADGSPWTLAGRWGLRGLLGGLAAGTIMGAVSGIYHVEETASKPAGRASQPAGPSRLAHAPPAGCRLAPARRPPSN